MLMKVTSKKSLSFPKLGWGITKGESRELPEDKDAQEQILAHPDIITDGEKGKSERSSSKAEPEDGSKSKSNK